ncbi:hypothetical protein ABT168_00555 [Streptomyces sp. NPDC001793]|uniref:hypothetical protein n=1 Tax=Streptomyces sp. NPDC001793 TaxID=3154657 RepID=UPI00332797E7
MAFIIAQGLPLPVNLQQGEYGFFPIDLLLTPHSEPIKGEKLVLAVTLPEGVTFPDDGKVFYNAPGVVRHELHVLDYDKANRLLRFENTVHLDDGSPEAGGFYSVGVRVLDDARPGLVWGQVEIGTSKAPLRIQITVPQPTENLIVNGGFVHYEWKSGEGWYDNKGTEYAKDLRQIGSWKVGQYEGKGAWHTSETGEPGTLVDLLKGDTIGNFPQDTEYPFVPHENIVDIDGAKTCGFIKQTVTVSPGSWYELSFYTGYHFLRTPVSAPTYLRAEVLVGDPAAEGPTLVWDDYVQYYTGQQETPAKAKLNAPGWRKRRLRFRTPAGVDQVTVRFANPGRAGFDHELSADPDGDTGMLLAHIRLSPAPPAP